MLKPERKHFLFSLTTGLLGLTTASLELVAIITPHWATVRSTSQPGISSDEEAFYGPWKLCVTVLKNVAVRPPDCRSNVIGYSPSGWSMFAGILAIGNFVLLVAYLLAVLTQIRTLNSQSMKTITFADVKVTFIKVLTALVGSIISLLCLVVFAVTLRQSEEYEVPTSWSFGIQLTTNLLELLLLIESAAEFSLAKKQDLRQKAREAKMEITKNASKFAAANGAHHKNGDAPIKPVTYLNEAFAKSSEALTKVSSTSSVTSTGTQTDELIKNYGRFRVEKVLETNPLALA